jgi:hypothetical protein
VKTFIVTEKDVVHEKDLGANTATGAITMPADYKRGWAAADNKKRQFSTSIIALPSTGAVPLNVTPGRHRCPLRVAADPHLASSV